MENLEKSLSRPGLALPVTFGLLLYLVWQIYGTPIRRIPGPFLASMTRLWHVWYILRGDQNAELVRLHDAHGMCDDDSLPNM